MGLISRIRKRFARKTTTTTSSQPPLSSVPLSTVGGQSVPLPPGGFTPSRSPTSGRSFTPTTRPQTTVEKILTPKKIQVPVKQKTIIKRRIPKKIPEKLITRLPKKDIISRKQRKVIIAAEQKRKRDILLEKAEETKFAKAGKRFTEEGEKTFVQAALGLSELIKDPRKVKDIPEGLKNRALELSALAKTDKAGFVGALTGEAILWFIPLKVKGVKGAKLKPVKNLRGKNLIIETPKKITKTPLSKTFPKEFTLKINDKAVEKFVKKQVERRGGNFEKLSGIDKNFLIGQVKARITNQPELFIPKARQLALKKAKVKNLRRITKERLIGKFNEPIKFRSTGKKILKELTKTQKLSLERFAKGSKKLEKKAIERVKKKGLKPEKIKIELSKFDKGIIRSRIKALIKAQPTKFIPKERKLALKRLSKLQEKKAIERVKKKGLSPKEIKTSDLISKFDKGIIVSRIKARVKASPREFIPPARKQALVLLKKPQLKVKPIKKIITQLDIRPTELTSTQKLALKKIQSQKNRLNKQVQKIRQKSQKKQNQIQKQIQKPKSKFKQVQLQKQLSKQKTFTAQKLKSRTKQLSKLNLRLGSLLRQSSKQAQKLKTAQKFKEVQKTKQTQKSKQRILLKEKQKSKQKGKVGARFEQPLREKLKLARVKQVKPKPKKKPITKKQAFNVFARPLKKIGQKKKPKLIKVNKKPLTKERAKDLGSSVVDTSLSRRFKIKPTGGKPKKGVLKAPIRNFDRTKKKFRDFRIVKGKKVPLKNTFIEKKGKPLLDTRGEKRGITLRRRIKMLNNLAKARKVKQSKKTTRKGRKK